jgi:hypothetical protein
VTLPTEASAVSSPIAAVLEAKVSEEQIRNLSTYQVVYQGLTFQEQQMKWQ